VLILATESKIRRLGVTACWPGLLAFCQSSTTA